MTLTIDYNINGIGNINLNIYRLGEVLLDDKKIDLEKRLKNINQLGTIKYLHNGAHYNRYEYSLLQISIIDFIKNNSKIGLGSRLNSESWGLNDSEIIQKQFTVAEILQSIILCSNLGHFKETFAANKVWFYFLNNNTKKIKNVFKSSLSKEGKILFDKFMTENDYQRIHYINSIFILNRNSNNRISRIIFEKFIEMNSSEPSLDRWIDLYNKVRKVSYIVLDSHFSYIPIDIDLQNILFNQKLFIDELSKPNSTLFAVLDRLNDLLEDTLYLENNSLLMGSYRSHEIAQEISAYIQNVNNEFKIKDIYNLLYQDEKSPFIKNSEISTQGIPWNIKKNLSLSYQVIEKSKFPSDVFKKELEDRKRLGQDCFVAYNYNPGYEKYRTVYSLNNKISGKNLIDKVLKIISIAATEYLRLKEFSAQDINNGNMQEVVIKKLLTYFFRNSLIKDYFCEYLYNKKSPPFFIEKGSAKTAKKIREYIKQVEKIGLLNKDQLHEIKTIEKRVSEINYRGLVIVFCGSLTFIDENRKSICELDGVILMPNLKDNFMNIIEAKNYNSKRKNVNVAKKQLEDKFLKIINSEIFMDLSPKEISDCGAYVQLKI